MEKKEYQLLNITSMAFKVFSVIALIAGFIAFISILIAGGSGGAQIPKTASIIWLLGGTFYSFLFLMLSEIIKVLVKIEQNTRPK